MIRSEITLHIRAGAPAAGGVWKTNSSTKRPAKLRFATTLKSATMKAGLFARVVAPRVDTNLKMLLTFE